MLAGSKQAIAEPHGTGKRGNTHRQEVGNGSTGVVTLTVRLAPAKNLQQTRHHPQSPSPDGEESLARTRRNGPAAP